MGPLLPESVEKQRCEKLLFKIVLCIIMNENMVDHHLNLRDSLSDHSAKMSFKSSRETANHQSRCSYSCAISVIIVAQFGIATHQKLLASRARQRRRSCLDLLQLSHLHANAFTDKPHQEFTLKPYDVG